MVTGAITLTLQMKQRAGLVTFLLKVRRESLRRSPKRRKAATMIVSVPARKSRQI